MKKKAISEKNCQKGDKIVAKVTKFNLGRSLATAENSTNEEVWHTMLHAFNKST